MCLRRAILVGVMSFLGLMPVGCGGSATPSQPPIAAERCCPHVVLLRSDGTVEEVTEGVEPRWLPGHEQLIFKRWGETPDGQATQDLWITNRNGTVTRQLTFNGLDQVRFIGVGGHPPLIAYDDDFGIWTMTVNGRDRHIIVRDHGIANALAVSPDGSKIAFATNSEPGHPASLHVVNVLTKRQTVAFRGTIHTCSVNSPTWSPDSRWVAFALCTDTGGLNLETGIWATTPNGGGFHQILMNAYSPAWSPDGEWIAFVTQKEITKTLETRSAVGQIHPDGSDKEFITPYEYSPGDPGPFEALSW